MKTPVQFSLPRFAKVLQNDLRRFARPILLGTAAVIAFLLINYVANVDIHQAPDESINFHPNMFGILLFIGGLVLTSFAFFELGRKEEGISFLLLPASHLEKWLSRWLITGFGFAAYFSLAYSVLSLAGDGITMALTGNQVQSLNIFADPAVLLLKVYLVVHSVFLAGAVIFGRLSVVKTPAALIVIGLAFVLVTIVLFKVVFLGTIPLADFEPPRGYQITTSYQVFTEETLWPLAQWLFWWIVPPFFWLTSFLRLNEKEV